MKKIALLLFCSCLPIWVFAQTTTTIFASGAVGSYTTGSAIYTPPPPAGGVYTRNDNTIAVSNGSASKQAGYAVFDLSSIPVGAVISRVALVFDVVGITAGVYGPCITYGRPGDLSTVTNATTLYNDCTGTGGTVLWNAPLITSMGSYYSTLTPPGLGVGDDSCVATAGVPVIFISSNAGGIISISFSGGGSYVFNIRGESGSTAMSGPHAPYLQVTYTGTVTPCTGAPTPGTVSASASSACATTSVTLTDAGYSSGTTLQWQSSPDSLTWTTVSGATSAAYTFTGLSATTYYRNMVTCTASGLSSPTMGKKITYILCCTGTPTAGTTTASTTYCSSCSLILDLTGASSGYDITYQWQSSSNGATWSNIVGATSVPYTFTPYGAYYYRCKANCTASGLFSYSSSVFVDYAYHIIADSVCYPIDSLCNAPKFYVKVNGTSTLLRLKTYYGDGTKDSITLFGIGTTSYANATHSYTCAGTHTIKQVLYYNNTPQDSITFNYYHIYCKTFSLRFYRDANGDCIQNAGEPFNFTPIAIKVDSAGIPIDTLTATSGLYYNAKGGPGTGYSFSMLPSYIFSSCPASGTFYDTIRATAAAYPIKKYALSCTTPSTFDLLVYAVIPINAANMQKGTIYVRNDGCTQENATVTLNYSPLYTGYPWILPSPASSSLGMMTWNIPSLSGNITTIKHMNYTVYAHSGAYLTIGSTVNELISVTPTTGDANISNNTEGHTDTVTGPYDPNIIAVIPEGCFPNDTQLQYTINFENTGNDTAHNIHVMDTLSDNLDVYSLRLVMASADMNIEIFKDGPYNIAKFDFPQINLLDSTHYGECDGAIIFAIKTKAGIANGSAIFNRAGIYFDYNDVVMTNTLENIKGCPITGVPVTNNVHKVEIYPNPTTDELTIKMDKDAYSSCVITNSIGQVLMQQPLSGTQTKVNVKMLPAGLYYITVKGDNGSKVQKFVKM